MVQPPRPQAQPPQRQQQPQQQTMQAERRPMADLKPPPSHGAPAVITQMKPPRNVAEILESPKFVIPRLAEVAIKEVLPAERVFRLIVNAVRKTPKLIECNAGSFLGAMMAATGLGLEPNTVEGLAYLIPFERRTRRRLDNGDFEKDARGRDIWDSTYECTYITGYAGYINLFYRKRSLIKEVHSDVVYEEDRFVHNRGSNTLFEHTKSLLDDPGMMIAAYCYTGLVEGQSFTVLPMREVYKARARSETYRAVSKRLEILEMSKTTPNQWELDRATKNYNETPWVLWEPQMAAKTAIRAHAHRVSATPEIRLASALDGNDEGFLDLKAMADPDVAKRAFTDGEIPGGHPDDDDDRNGYDDDRGDQQQDDRQQTDQQGGQQGEGGASSPPPPASLPAGASPPASPPPAVQERQSGNDPNGRPPPAKRGRPVFTR